VPVLTLEKKSSSTHSLTANQIENAHSIALNKCICDNTVAIKQQNRAIFSPEC
jgi:hypothetical protein